MISVVEIRSNLRVFSAGFKKSRSKKGALFFSKYAILETCGWIEEAIDDIVENFASKTLPNKDKNEYKKEIMRRNSNMGSTNFKKLIIELIGRVNLIALELEHPSTFDTLYSNLDQLRDARNPEAHTHVRNAPRNIDAPSVTRGRLEHIYRELKKVEELIYQVHRAPSSSTSNTSVALGGITLPAPRAP
jgi:hypothetical protein